MSQLPIIYSFRRCPYAMRARLGLKASGVRLELREVILREKPDAMLEASPKGTVPVLIEPDGNVIDESLDIIHWSMVQATTGSEAEDWAETLKTHNDEFHTLIAENDGPFKASLDAYKYPDRYPDADRKTSRTSGGEFLWKLNAQLEGRDFLISEKFSVFDAAILPFVRQFAHVDQEWFYAQDWVNVIRWLDAFKNSDRFESIMTKYDKWEPDADEVLFGGELN